MEEVFIVENHVPHTKHEDPCMKRDITVQVLGVCPFTCCLCSCVLRHSDVKVYSIASLYVIQC